MHYNNWNEGVGARVGSRVQHVEHPNEEKFFEHCTNCAILPRPLSRDHFCENLASLLFHSSAGERLQYKFITTIQIQIYHGKNHIISLYFYHSIKFQLKNLCKG